jgi:hypothetical protein
VRLAIPAGITTKEIDMSRFSSIANLFLGVIPMAALIYAAFANAGGVA